MAFLHYMPTERARRQGGCMASCSVAITTGVRVPGFLVFSDRPDLLFVTCDVLVLYIGTFAASRSLEVRVDITGARATAQATAPATAPAIARVPLLLFIPGHGTPPGRYWLC